MAREHSFTITLSNNLTEKAGLAHLLDKEPEWFVPDSAGRNTILVALGLDKKFRRAFDLVWIPGRKRNGTTELTIDPTTIILIELKTTRKKLPRNPRGFFFGATDNEFKLARTLGESYRFCFVCLHPETPTHFLLSLAELEKAIRVKRIQYQINLA